MCEQHLESYLRRNEAALSHSCEDVVQAFASETLEGTRRRLMSRRFALADIVIVIDRDGRYPGIVETTYVLSQCGTMVIEEIARRDWPYAAPDLDQERAVEMAATAGITTLPVVAADGRPLGCIPAKALMEVMAAEHREDVHRMAGILRQNSDGREVLDGSPLHRFARRMPWLLIGLALIPPALSPDPWDPGIRAERCDTAGLGAEAVPCFACGFGNRLVVGEQAVRQEAFLEVEPDALDRVQFGRVGR